MYRAIESGEAVVISAFSSDGRIAAQDLLVLTDPKQAIPSSGAMVLLSPARAADPVLRRALEALIGAVTVERVREANLMVNRDQDKALPAPGRTLSRRGLLVGAA